MEPTHIIVILHVTHKYISFILYFLSFQSFSLCWMIVMGQGMGVVVIWVGNWLNTVVHNTTSPIPTMKFSSPINAAVTCGDHSFHSFLFFVLFLFLFCAKAF